MGKILVVDDEIVIGQLLTDVLKNKGHEVTYSSRSLDGLSIAEKDWQTIDLYILDFKMPEMNGVVLVTKI